MVVTSGSASRSANQVYTRPRHWYHPTRPRRPPAPDFDDSARRPRHLPQGRLEDFPATGITGSSLGDRRQAVNAGRPARRAAGHAMRAQGAARRGRSALSSGRRLAVNALANWSGTAVATLASLLLAPYLLQHLGAERFGLYQVGRQLVAYFLLLNLGIAGSVMRFTSEAIAARDDARVNAVSNSALVLFLGVALAGLLVGLGTGYLAPGFFRVDPSYVAETRGLIWALGVWWALGMLASPARGILIGQQRFGWLNLVMAAGWLLALALIFGLFELGHVSLLAVGIAFAAPPPSSSSPTSGLPGVCSRACAGRSAWRTAGCCASCSASARGTCCSPWPGCCSGGPTTS